MKDIREKTQIIPFLAVGEQEEHISVRCMNAGIDMIKLKRNDPCPCGSGKKYKKCCIKENPYALCERFAIAERRFEAADRLGAFEVGNENAEIFNDTLKVLMKLDRATFSRFKPLPIRDPSGEIRNFEEIRDPSGEIRNFEETI